MTAPTTSPTCSGCGTPHAPCMQPKAAIWRFCSQRCCCTTAYRSKNSPLRSQASRLAADKASSVLKELDWPNEKISNVAHAIEAHSFSANITPITLEAKIVQDADRLDSLGMLGVARTFYVAGRMGSALYDPQDPEALEREYDDTRFCLDHFQTKLLHLADGFQTVTGQRLAHIRHQRLKGFMEQFKEEIGIV